MRWLAGFSPPVSHLCTGQALEATAKVVLLCGWDLGRERASMGSCVGRDSWKVASERGQGSPRAPTWSPASLPKSSPCFVPGLAVRLALTEVARVEMSSSSVVCFRCAELSFALL